MATTNSNDISIVLSGGTTNFSPNNSLGGQPSSAPITSAVINNLFDDVSPEESEDGHEDYRCVYIFNDGETPIYLIEVYIQEDFEEGATMEIGIEKRDETQRLTLDNATPTGGSLTLSYAGNNFISNYDSDLGDWAVALQTSLNNILIEGENLLKDVAVTAQTATGGVIIFDINFVDSDGARNHDKIVIEANNLTPASVGAAVSTTQEGSPINTVAPTIGLETTPPGGISFFAASQQSPITLPRLDPADGFPLWVKRFVPSGTTAKASDGFTLRFVAETLEPND